MSDNNKRYAFGTIARRENPKGPIINAVYFPTDRELEAYHASVKELDEWVRQDTFALVEYSHHQFRLTAEAIEKEFIKSARPPQAKSFMLSLNATFLNYLGMMRLYLDHTEYKLKRSKTANQNEYQQFKTSTASRYDNVFAYRFSYKLRNYAQHCGFPIGGLQANGQVVNHNPNNIERSFEVTFKRDDLLKNYDSWGSVIKEELQVMDIEFPVIPIADELLVALRHINDGVLRACLPRLERASKLIADVVERTIKPGVTGAPHLIGLPANQEDFKLPSISLTLQPVPIEHILTVQKLATMFTKS